jgi:hypothetical protein
MTGRSAERCRRAAATPWPLRRDAGARPVEDIDDGRSRSDPRDAQRVVGFSVQVSPVGQGRFPNVDVRQF